MSDKLSRDEILTLEAGREMDALVARRVMGWKHHPSSLWELPAFSDDIAAAWQVVEKMLARGYEISLANREDREGYSFWGVDFYVMIDEAALDACFTADAPTVELAICRAALLATLEDET